ncbi:MAG: hypothetical protein WC586_13000 [Methanoregula sp.]
MTDSFSPRARLVLFMVCLAIFGSVVTTVHDYAVDLPAQKSNAPPDNGTINPKLKCDICEYHCKDAPDFYACMSECSLIC